MITVLVAGDTRVYIDALANLVAQHDDISVVGIAASADETLAQAAELEPGILLLDLRAGWTFEVARALFATRPALRFVAVGMADEAEALACVEAGILGCLPREGRAGELIEILRRTARGELLCPPQLAAALIRRLVSLSPHAQTGALLAELTARERQILACIDRGLSNKEIAQELHIQPATVKNHVHNLLEKLHVHRRRDAARMSQRPSGSGRSA